MLLTASTLKNIYFYVTYNKSFFHRAPPSLQGYSSLKCPLLSRSDNDLKHAELPHVQKADGEVQQTDEVCVNLQQNY